ncbi:MAG: phage portal protein [Sulfitobacter sp.]
MMVNFLDRAILSLSPERGLRRIKAKSAANAVMNYDAASRGRRTSGWKAPATAADASAFGNRPRLRNLSRDMIRNRPYAARAQSVVTGNVVGTGIMPSVEMDPENQASSEAALKFLKSHLMTTAIDAAGVNTLPGLQTQVMNAVFSDGEVLARQRLRKRSFNSKLPLLFQVQLMECDYLDETKQSHGRNEVVEGIEYGPTGRIEAYHLYDRHPGDVQFWRGRQLASSRVPAGQILHVRRSDRPGQMRGAPWLAPVMMALGELSDYQEAEILKQRMAALLAFFRENEDAIPDAAKTQISELAPGAVIDLEPGQKITPTSPPSKDGYSDFMRQGVFTIAMGLGITGESLSGDLRGVNFSSGRMGRMEMDRFIQVWQQQLVIDQFCAGIGEWSRDVWRMQGQSEPNLPPVPASIGWTAPRRPLIDPSKEISASVAEIDAGLTSRSRKQRELGYDPETIAAERAEDALRDGKTPTFETED